MFQELIEIHNELANKYSNEMKIIDTESLNSKKYEEAKLGILKLASRNKKVLNELKKIYKNLDHVFAIINLYRHNDKLEDAS